MNGAARRSAVAEAHPSEAAGITPRLAEILAMMVDAALEAEDAGSVVRGMVTLATPSATPSRPVQVGERRTLTEEGLR